MSMNLKYSITQLQHQLKIRKSLLFSTKEEIIFVLKPTKIVCRYDVTDLPSLEFAHSQICYLVLYNSMSPVLNLSLD